MPVSNDSVEPVSSIMLQADAIPKEHHFEAWFECSRPLFETKALKQDWKLLGDCTISVLGSLVFTHVQFSESRFSRDSRHLVNSDNDSIVLQFNVKGRQYGLLTNGTELLLTPDRICLQDFAHSYTAVSEDTDTYGVIIPRHLLASSDLLYRKSPVFSWPVDSPQGKLLRFALRAIWNDLPDIDSCDGETIAAGFIGLLNGLLTDKGNLSHRLDVENATFEAMKCYLADHIAESALSAECLCRHYQCSRATVYRLFAKEGGVKTFIRDQRLIRCYRELIMMPNGRKKSIREVAEKWGFSNMAQFCRLFKKRYGMKPSDAISASGQEKPTPRPCGKNGYLQEIDQINRLLMKF